MQMRGRVLLHLRSAMEELNLRRLGGEELAQPRRTSR
jgi:hypothetical protein